MNLKGNRSIFQLLRQVNISFQRLVSKTKGNLFSDDSYIAYQFPRYVIEDSITAKETLEQYYTDDVHAEIKTDVSESGGIEVAVAVSEMSNDSGIKDETSAHVPERILLEVGLLVARDFGNLAILTCLIGI